MFLATHVEEYEKGELMLDTARSLFGNGIFNSNVFTR